MIFRNIVTDKEWADDISAVHRKGPRQAVNRVSTPTAMYAKCCVAEDHNPAIIHVLRPQTGPQCCSLIRGKLSPVRDLSTRTQWFETWQPVFTT
ncbi:MAG: hypothetical protein QOD64_282 [Verrucomicrobiota bacterium]